MGRYITTVGTAGTTTREISTTFSASVNDRILANTASSAYTITLPANSSLLVSDTIQIIDISNNASSNNLTIGRNSSKINGASEDLTIDVVIIRDTIEKKIIYFFIVFWKSFQFLINLRISQIHSYYFHINQFFLSLLILQI